MSVSIESKIEYIRENVDDIPQTLTINIISPYFKLTFFDFVDVIPQKQLDKIILSLVKNEPLETHINIPIKALTDDSGCISIDKEYLHINGTSILLDKINKEDLIKFYTSLYVFCN